VRAIRPADEEEILIPTHTQAGQHEAAAKALHATARKAPSQASVKDLIGIPVPSRTRADCGEADKHLWVEGRYMVVELAKFKAVKSTTSGGGTHHKSSKGRGPREGVRMRGSAVIQSYGFPSKDIYIYIEVTVGRSWLRKANVQRGAAGKKSLDKHTWVRAGSWEVRGLCVEEHSEGREFP
jgi:hypothetical protein